MSSFWYLEGLKEFTREIILAQRSLALSFSSHIFHLSLFYEQFPQLFPPGHQHNLQLCHFHSINQPIAVLIVVSHFCFPRHLFFLLLLLHSSHDPTLIRSCQGLCSACLYGLHARHPLYRGFLLCIRTSLMPQQVKNLLAIQQTQETWV